VLRILARNARESSISCIRARGDNCCLRGRNRDSESVSREDLELPVFGFLPTIESRLEIESMNRETVLCSVLEPGLAWQSE